MRVVVIGLLLIGLGSKSQAQDARLMNFTPFKEAAVVLNTGSIITGSLHFYFDLDVVSLSTANDSAYTLPAHLVRGFAAKDDPNQQRPGDTFITLQRIFRTFPLSAKSGSAVVWGFYEQLNRGPGPVLLLRREQTSFIPIQLSSPSGANGHGVFGQGFGIVKSSLYIGTATGEPVVLRKPADIFKHLAQYAPQLRAYARQNELRYTDNMRDLSFLVNYANTLVKAKP